MVFYFENVQVFFICLKINYFINFINVWYNVFWFFFLFQLIINIIDVNDNLF